MNPLKYTAFGLIFFQLLGFACIGIAIWEKKEQELAEQARRKAEWEEYWYPSDLYRMSPEEYRAFYNERRNRVEFPGIRKKPEESYEEYSKRAANEVEKLLGHPKLMKRANQRLRMQQSNGRDDSPDETDIMEHLSNAYDAYMDYDPYDADVSPTGNPEEDEIFFYEAFIEGDGGEWETYEEEGWDE